MPRMAHNQENGDCAGSNGANTTHDQGQTVELDAAIPQRDLVDCATLVSSVARDSNKGMGAYFSRPRLWNRTWSSSFWLGSEECGELRSESGKAVFSFSPNLFSGLQQIQIGSAASNHTMRKKNKGENGKVAEALGTLEHVGADLAWKGLTVASILGVSALFIHGSTLGYTLTAMIQG